MRSIAFLSIPPCGKRVYQYLAFPLARLALLLLDCIFVSEGAGAFYPESG